MHVVVGAGVNGLSVAWALAERGADVLLLDKGRVGGGAAGIAGGIVRNFYRSEPIAELVRLSVDTDSMQTVRRLASRARDAGVEIREQVEVAGFELAKDSVTAVLSHDGRIACERLVLAPGPWAAGLLAMLGVDARLDYWKAQEGEFALTGAGLSGRAGSEDPMVHLDQAGPLRSDRDGRMLVDGAWGIYFRMGRTGTGITGGGLPVLLTDPELDPYGPENPAHTVEPEFEDFFT